MNTQVQNAVKNATGKNDGSDVELRTQHVVVMTDTLRETAVRAIEATFKAYNAKNGLRELTEKLVQAEKSTATHILGLAQTAQRKGGVYPGQIKAWFGALCSVAEVSFKDTHKVTDLAEALPCWAVYKSEILRAVKVGLRPLDYDSFTSMKAARIAKDKADREAAQPTERGARPEGNAQRAEGSSNIAQATTAKVIVTPQLAATVKIMQASIERMDSATQDLFAQKLSQLIAKFNDKLQPTQEAPKPAEATEQVPAAAEQAA